MKVALQRTLRGTVGRRRAAARAEELRLQQSAFGLNRLPEGFFNVCVFSFYSILKDL